MSRSAHKLLRNLLLPEPVTEFTYVRSQSPEDGFHEPPVWLTTVVSPSTHVFDLRRIKSRGERDRDDS
jgi:hypothetical protein